MNPYNYNTVSLNKNRKSTAIPTAAMMLTSSFYNAVGKFLGVDTHHEWNQYYDKVYHIANWAKEKSKNESTEDVIQFLYTKMQKTPAITGKRVNDMYVMSKLTSEPKNAPQARTVVREVQKPGPIKEKTVVKEVKVEKKEPKEDTQAFVNNWLKQTLEGISA